MGKEYNYHAPRHSPLFLDQTEVRKAEKKFWRPGLPSPYLRVWMTTPPPSPPPFSQGLDPALQCAWLYSDMVEHLIWNWADLKIKTKNTRLFWNKWNKFNVSDISTLFFPTCHALTTWVELSSVKWYKKRILGEIQGKSILFRSRHEVRFNEGLNWGSRRTPLYPWLPHSTE